MLKRAISCMTYRKKSTVWMLLFLTIAAFMLQSIGPLFDSVIEVTFEEGVDTYGRHHAAFFGLTEKQLQMLRTDDRTDTLGVMYNHGTYRLKDHGQILTFGSFDKTAQELGSIDVIEGTYPQRENEVALESHLRDLPQGEPLQIGDILHIQVNDETVSLTITGFLQDYTGQWNSFDVLQPGMNDYPHCILAEENILSARGNINVLLHLCGAAKTVLPAQSVLRVSIDTGVYEENQMIFNDAAYGSGQEQRIYTLRQVKMLFTILGATGAGLLLYIAWMTYLKPYTETAQTMYMLGATNFDTIFTLLLWVGMLSIAGIGIGIALSKGFFLILRTKIEYIQQGINYWVVPLVLIAAMQGAAGLFFVQNIWQYRRVSWSKRNANEPVKEISLHQSIVLPLTGFHLSRNWKRMMGMCVLLAMYLTLLLCVQHQAQSTKQAMDIPTISVSSMEGYGLNFYDEFELASKAQGYDIDAVNAISELPGVRSIKKSYYAKPASLIYPEDGDDRYFNQLMQRYSVGSWATGVEVKSIPEGMRATRDGYAIVVLDKWNANRFYEYYPDAKKPAKGEVILFCPVFQQEENFLNTLMQDGDKGDITNTAYQEGETLRFGMIEAEDFLAAIEQPDTISYREESVVIRQVYNQSMQNLQAEGEYFPLICVVMTEETAEMLSFTEHVSKFHIEMEQGLERSDYERIEAEAHRLGLTLQGARVCSYLQEKDFFERLTKAVEVGYAAISVVIVVFILFAIINIIYETLLQRVRQFGILRATGYRKYSLFWTVWLEMQVYWLISFLLTVALAVWGVHQYSVYICGPIIEGAGYGVLLMQICKYMSGVLVLFTLIAWLITRSVFKKSISSCIRFAE